MAVLGYIFLVIIIMVIISKFRGSSQPIWNDSPNSRNIEFLDKKYKLLVDSLLSIHEDYTLSIHTDGSLTISRNLNSSSLRFELFEEFGSLLNIVLAADGFDKPLTKVWVFKSTRDQNEMFDIIVADLKNELSGIVKTETKIVLPWKEPNIMTDTILLHPDYKIIMTIPIPHPTTTLDEFYEMMSNVIKLYISESDKVFRNIKVKVILNLIVHYIDHEITKTVTLAVERSISSEVKHINIEKVSHSISLQIWKNKARRIEQL